MQAVGFDDSLLIVAWPTSEKIEYYLSSIDGSILAEPRRISMGELNAGPLALGADGVWYFVNCTNMYGRMGDLEVLALSPSLEVIARLDAGYSCSIAGGVEVALLDDGTLLIPRRGKDFTGEIVRIATASPGLARTAWPKHMRDNENTGWIAAW